VRAQVVRALARYRAVGLTLLFLVAIIGAFPAVGKPPTTLVLSEGPDGPGSGAASTIVPNVGSGGSGGPGSSTGSGDPNDPGGPGTTDGATGALPANCDPATGRIKFPSVYAPPCVYPVSDNGGSTYQGVTGTEIKIVLYHAQEDPTVTALLKAAGASDDFEDVYQQYLNWISMFEKFYETYGRHVKLEVIHASGETTNDAAARADAITVATQMKPFAVIGGPSPFVDELSRRGIICITQLQRPIEYFQERAPFVWGSQMSSTQAFLHLGEYIGKRLAGENAIHAGSDELRGKPRKFGIIYLDTSEGVYSPGVDSLEREMGRYGVELADRVSYVADINTAQEQSRVIIARLKDKGITSVLFSGDPIAPIFFTQEATRQEWFPEWVIPGGTLVDTTFFGRTYDQQQWSHAFGISQLYAMPNQDQTEVWYQHQYTFGTPPVAAATYGILYQEPMILFTGIHMAGPNLNPITFRDGLFAYPVSGRGQITNVQRSYGRQGLWPFDDYTAFDNVTEVWWNPNVTGEDEIGNHGAGMLEFVNGGKRYVTGEWPNSPPDVFNPANSVTGYESLPPSDQFPTYPKAT